MSLTRTRGIYRAGNWTTVSAVVVEYLDYLLETFRDTKKVEVPTSAIMALQGLLSSALPATRDEPMRNPEASINDYLIVQEVMGESGERNLEREDVRKGIKEYSSLLDLLTKPHQMKDLPRELTVKTRIFFCNLEEKGKMEGYDRHMRESHPYNHPDDPPDDE